MDTNTSLVSYPSRGEVDRWLDSIWDLVDATECPAELLADQGFTHNLGIRHTPGFRYIRFPPAGMSEFFGYWQPALSCPAPLLVHVPGYGAEMSAHPDLVAAGFNVLHISPLGYSTPKGADETKRRDGSWPVLPDTILSRGKKGYREWLAHCAMGVGWALRRTETIDNRMSFFGSSQGGGGALLLASLFRGRGVRCAAADVPFLTDFPGARDQGAYRLFSNTLRMIDDKESAWHAAGLIDTLSHVHRLDLPVLLTAGGSDETCPPHTIEALFARLPATRSYTYGIIRFWTKKGVDFSSEKSSMMLEMNIIQLFETFETNLQAVEYLERVRWDDKPCCHYCESKRTSIHKSKDRAIRRWQCHECHRAFSVTVGTVFHRTHVPLKKWFLILALMLNAKKSTSSCQIARDLGMNQPTVWSIMHRIRAAMALDPEQEALFKGIVEADETYIGGKPRKENRTKDRTPRKRGLGTDKTPVLGVLERGGRVRTEVMDKVTCENLEWFLDRFVEKDRTILITDENPVYRRIGRKIAHAIINHSLAYVEQLTHTNGIESFWALVKRAWIGQHHHYSVKYMPLYLAEAAFKFNRRARRPACADSHADRDAFEDSIAICVNS